ncbi:hypothetical protein DKX38_022154 [Salix brachista]|uniref:Uncharacterized protein n=1 Tax=Salix brachista TaxID=2182728 RepID=A0A5N5K4L5_9ROSI|nr:hypothetical protein DKX38_022154 [Salix brachista]
MRRPGSGLSVKRNAKKNIKKPGICTADELHYVAVSNSEWKLALWRYCLPSPKAKTRNHAILGWNQCYRFVLIFVTLMLMGSLLFILRDVNVVTMGKGKELRLSLHPKNHDQAVRNSYALV